VDPRVSVIVPAYNTARLIGETLESIFRQTFRDFEVVVVNDDSPDTAELELALRPFRERIVYIRKQRNEGLAAARNTGIRAARGELIALLDSDDVWESNYLEVQTGYLERDTLADIVYCDGIIFGSGDLVGRRISEFSPSKGEVTFTSLVNEQCCVVVSVLARRSALVRAGLFDDRLRSCEDFDLWLRCVKSGSRIIYHNQVLLRYRRREGSLSSNLVWMNGHAATVLRKILSSVPLTDDERRAVEKKIEYFDGLRLYFEGKEAFLAGHYSLAVEKLQEAHRHRRSPRTLIILMLVRTVPRLARLVYAWPSRKTTSPQGVPPRSGVDR
jgi:glycosyltransferase involved in cell wall biosynthesis